MIRVSVASICVVAAWLSAAAWATTLRALSPEELVARSDRIAVVHVGAQGTVLDAESGRLFTVARASVKESWKGNGADEIRIRRSGGRLGDRVEWIPGAPVLETDKSYLVFLESLDEAEGYYTVVGMEQGLWPVKDDAVKMPRRSVTYLTETGETLEPTLQGSWMPLNAVHERIQAAP